MNSLIHFHFQKCILLYESPLLCLKVTTLSILQNFWVDTSLKWWMYKHCSKKLFQSYVIMHLQKREHTYWTYCRANLLLDSLLLSSRYDTFCHIILTLLTIRPYKTSPTLTGVRTSSWCGTCALVQTWIGIACCVDCWNKKQTKGPNQIKFTVFRECRALIYENQTVLTSVSNLVVVVVLFCLFVCLFVVCFVFYHINLCMMISLYGKKQNKPQKKTNKQTKQQQQQQGCLLRSKLSYTI